MIKRYPNRKLYNTETKEYITLDGIAELIRMGEEIHVIDHATGQDLTALTLSQILFEQVKQQTGFLPRTMLTGLIQAGGSRLSAIQRAVFASFGLKHLVDDEIRRRVDALIDRGEIAPQEGDQMLEKLLSARGDAEEPSPDAALEEYLARRGIATGQEMQDLREKIDALAAKIDAISQEKNDYTST